MSGRGNLARCAAAVAMAGLRQPCASTRRAVASGWYAAYAGQAASPVSSQLSNVSSTEPSSPRSISMPPVAV